MRVFVTGASGYIGSAVVRALAQGGHTVVGMARSHKPTHPSGDGIEWVFGNLRDPGTYAEAAGGCDAIVHAAVEYGQDVSTLDLLAVRTLRAAATSGRPKLLLYTSGIWVIGPTGDTPVDESVPADNPPPAVAWRPSHERAVLEGATASLSTVVVRPGMVFGGKGGFFEQWFTQAEQEKAPVVVGDGNNRWPTVHVGDVAALYRLVVEKHVTLRHLPPGERLFHCVSGASERTGELARAASLAVGRDGRVELWPVTEARASLGAAADAVAMDQVIISRRADRVLGFKPRFEGFIPHAKEMAVERKS